MNESMPVCWLFPADPGPFPEPFVAHDDDFTRFKEWYRALFSLNEPTCEDLLRISNTYAFILSTNPDVFDFDWSLKAPASGIHQRLKRDLTRYFKVLVLSYHLPVNSSKLDFIVHSFARMLLFLDFNSLAYRRIFIDFLVPIFHVCFHGMWSRCPEAEERLDYATVEALAATALVRFLSAPPFEFLRLLGGGDRLTNFTNQFLEKLARFQLFQTRRTFSKLPFLGQWVGHFFAGAWGLGQVVEIWDWVIRSSRNRTFPDALAAVCAAIPVEMRAECDPGDSEKLIEIIKDTGKLPVARLLARAAAL
jgi:hypothetical protein